MANRFRLPKKDWASYQLALRLSTWALEQRIIKKKMTVAQVQQMGAVIRAYRGEERKVN